MPAKQLKIRKLRASEVTFTVEVEPEHIDVRGNYMASDDPVFDGWRVSATENGWRVLPPKAKR